VGVFIDEQQIANLEKRMRERGYLEAPRWRAPSIAAQQRIDLVVRGQQLSIRQGAVPVRSVVLEFRFNAQAVTRCTVSICATVPQELHKSRAASN